MKKILTFSVIVASVAGFTGITAPKLSAAVSEQARLGAEADLKRAAKAAQNALSAVDPTGTPAEQAKAEAAAATANAAYAKLIVAEGRDAGLTLKQIAEFSASLNKVAARSAQAAMAIVSAPGFADGSTANAEAAASVATSVAAVVTNPAVIAASPGVVAAVAAQLAYVGTLASVVAVSPSAAAAAVSAANTVASSSALTPTQQASVQAAVATAVTIATANAGIQVTVSSSVNPTVVSVAQ